MSTIELPTEVVKASTKSPELLIIFSAPKSGKTSIVSQLPNNLIIDLERGSNYVDALKVQINTYQELYNLCSEIKKQNKPYKYVTIDTVTALEDMVIPLALKLYQQTPMGKTYNGDVLSLPNGGGYKYLRDAFQMMVDKVRECADKVILLGHTKDKIAEKEGKEVVSRELALTGKLSSITCAHADAIGFLYREKDQGILTFVTNNTQVCGARPKHLRNTNIVISEEINGELHTYWEKVFID